MSNAIAEGNNRKPPKLDERAIERRIQFILDEAKCDPPIRDQTVTIAMRVASNFYSTTMGNARSDTVKLKCKKMSRKALELYEQLSPAEWLKMTVNEHQEPLEQVWHWILEKKANLSIEEIKARFIKWPMVTVTCKEDGKLRKLRMLGPEKRYSTAGIDTVSRRDNGTWE